MCYPLRPVGGLLALVLFFAAGSAAQAEPLVPAALTEDGARFERVGAKTFRWMSVLKVYDISLHLGVGEPATRVFADIPKRLHLVYHRGFTAAEIVKGGDTLLARNVEAATLASLRDRLDLLNRTYRDVKPGDSYTLTYKPGVGTTLRLNGTVLITIPGADFAAAYFRIWLGEKPISASLRDTLLGR